MSLSGLINNRSTDKNTTHSYLDLYEKLLQSKKDTAEHVLEIGIGDFGPKTEEVLNYGEIILQKQQYTD